ncbi:MAG TPA: nuclear transport factor 2 family protein [Herpetosiphonaceae bacterium]
MTIPDNMLPINAGPRVQTAEDFECLEQARLAALVQRDMPLAWQLHAADFHLVTPRGAVYTRERYLGEVAEGLLTYLSWEPGPMLARTTPSMTLLRYQAQLVVDSGGGQGVALTCWHTDSYELRDGVWQVVWSQATALPAARSDAP